MNSKMWSSEAATANSGIGGTALHLQLIPYTCLVCGKLADLFIGPDGKRVEVKEEVEFPQEEDESGGELSEGLLTAKQLRNELEDEVHLFQFFFREMKIVKKLMSSWKFESEPVPFCEGCKRKLRQMRSMEEELRRLEDRYKRALQDFKEEMKNSEQCFQREDVYDRDERFLAVRTRLLGSTITVPREKKEQWNKQKDSTQDQNLETRKSSRLSKVLETKSGEHGVPTSIYITQCTLTKSMESSFGDDSLDYGDTCPSPTNSPLPTATDKDEEELAKSTNKTLRLRGERAAAKRAKSVISDVAQDEQSTSKPKRMKATVGSETEQSGSDSEDDEWEEHLAHSRTGRPAKDRSQKTSRATKTFQTAQVDEKSGKPRYMHVLYDEVSPGKYKCLECEAIVDNKTNVRRHAVNVHLTRKCPHPYCNYETANKVDCEEHYLLFHDQLVYNLLKCDVCGKPNGKRQHMHRFTHFNQEERKEAIARGDCSTGLLETECDECGEVCKNSNALRTHKLKVHYNQQRQQKNPVDDATTHLCPHCGFSTDKESSLKNHLLMRHPNPEDLKFVCVHCEKRFVKMSFLTRHKLVHSEEHPFHCSQCPKRFKTKKSLRVHEIEHTGVRPYQCEKCPMSFLYKNNAERHFQNYHAEGSKPGRATFTRGQDKSGFRTYGAVDSEKRPRPFHCMICPMTFLYKGHLKKHVQDNHADRGGNPERFMSCVNDNYEGGSHTIGPGIGSNDEPATACGKSFNQNPTLAAAKETTVEAYRRDQEVLPSTSNHSQAFFGLEYNSSDVMISKSNSYL